MYMYIPNRITRRRLGEGRTTLGGMANQWGDLAARQASSSDLGAPSRSTGLSTGSLERLCSLEVARQRLREAIWDDLGLSRGCLDPSESRSRVHENAISAKS